MDPEHAEYKAWSESNRDRRRTDRAALVRDPVRMPILVVVVATILFAFGFSLTLFKSIPIATNGMEPTIPAGSHVLVQRGVPIRDGDVVVFRSAHWGFPGTVHEYVKRVMAKGGETIQGRGRDLLRNGQVLDEPYVEHIGNPHAVGHTDDNFGPVTVPIQRLWMMGDNRDNSSDSRFRLVGDINTATVPESDVVGRVVLIGSLDAVWLRLVTVGLAAALPIAVLTGVALARRYRSHLPNMSRSRP